MNKNTVKLICSHCKAEKELIGTKEKLSNILEARVCDVCKSKMELHVPSTHPDLTGISVADIEYFMEERLRIISEKAKDMGLDYKIENNELFVKGKKSAVDFFVQSTDVFTIFQLMNYKASIKFMKMLQHVPDAILFAEGFETLDELAKSVELNERDLSQLIYTKI